MSTFDEERKNYSRTPLEEVGRENRLISFYRPLTAKKTDVDFKGFQKKISNRFGLRGKKQVKDKSSPLGKGRPSKISIDRERLYSENIELKQKNIELNKVLLKYKTKIIQLEREKNKKLEIPNQDSSLNSSFLVHLLKKNIKDLKFELSNKENEILKYKKNLKYTKVVEMELEIKAYVDECTRLKHYLEESLEKDSRFSETAQNEKMQTLIKVIEENNKEIQRLKDQFRVDKSKEHPKYQEEAKKYFKEIESLKEKFAKQIKDSEFQLKEAKKEISEEKGKNANLLFKLKEADKLIENLYHELKLTRQKKASRFFPPKILIVLFNLSKSCNLSVEDFLKTTFKNSSIPSSLLLEALIAFDSSLNKQDLSQIMNYIQGSAPSEVSVSHLISFFNTFDFSSEDPFFSTQVHEKISHLKLRMQLHRIEKFKFIESHFSSSNKTIHVQELILSLTKPPFNFSRQDAQMISSFIFGSKKSLSYYEFVQNFDEKIGDWEVFSQNDEETFDAFLVSLVTKNSEVLEKHCSAYDQNSSGFISVNDFKSVLLELSLKIPDKILKYLFVLFYSNNQVLNQVPYQQFFQAYITSQDKSEEKEDITFSYLEEIANKLIKIGSSVGDIFRSDQNGFVLAEDFIQGLQVIGMPELSKEDLINLMESLQNNKEDRVFCIRLKDLEEIMENYGVPVPGDDSSEDLEIESLAGGEGHVQKVSLLDSMELDC